MLVELADQTIATPDWLMKASLEDALPLRHILWRSFFYPACGYDGRPVQYFSGAVHSFVYVDQSCPRNYVEQALHTFKGYRLLFQKNIEQNTLGIKSFEPHRYVEEGDRRDFRFRSPYFSYALWAVFERLDTYGPEHGPERFSLLYIGGEAVSAYWSLYWRFNVSPYAIALVRCDGFTGNWTAFRDDKAELASLVMMAHPLMPPKYLVSSLQGQDASSPWRWYSQVVKKIPTSRPYQGLTVWKLFMQPTSPQVEERVRMGTARAMVQIEMAEKDKYSERYSELRARAANRRRQIEKLLHLRINPLLAAFFQASLSGCADLSCGTCGGRNLRKYLEASSTAEILSDLGSLGYDEVKRYEVEIRSVLIYLEAGYLSEAEINTLARNGVRNILDRMIEHHALRLERARLAARKERERLMRARQRQADLATERLLGAIRRRDQLAVRALLRKGANPDYVQFDGSTARLMARNCGVESWLKRSQRS
jgi:hypothetical protein